MPRDMFYEYEHNINKKEYPPMRPIDHPKKAISVHGAELLRNVKGDVLGVKAKANSDFTLYFYIDGEVEDGSVEELIDASEFFLQIIGADDEAIGEFKGEKYSSDTIKFDMGASDDSMPFGNYRMRLVMNYNLMPYELFSEKDAILSIQ